ncbi:MAG: hypothetical protein AB7F90_14775 [Nitrospirales bacterium]
MMRADVPYPNARHSENGAWSCIVVGQRSWKRQGADRRVRMFDVKSMVVIGGYNGIKKEKGSTSIDEKPCEEKNFLFSKKDPRRQNKAVGPQAHNPFARSNGENA